MAFTTNTTKYFLHDFEITDKKLIGRLKRSEYFKVVDTKIDWLNNVQYHYKFTGYSKPLLAYVSDKYCSVHTPYHYVGSYNYNGQDEITLHSTYGRLEHYKKIAIFDIPFMVESSMLNEEDIVLCAETDFKFIKSLISAL